jgi:hypothetical protein
LLAKSSFVAWFGVDVYSSFSLLISSPVFFSCLVGWVAHVSSGSLVSFVGVSLEGVGREGWVEVLVVLDMDGIHWSCLVACCVVFGRTGRWACRWLRVDCFRMKFPML